ncbi:MAG TPA: radical SAM protein, partial [Anaerolineae bacterium]|nr:radical SAM protein [Anaerolineae bacterium]
LADLLRAVHEVEGLWRIRFLTSHPSYLSDRILDAVAELPKVCEHIEVPVQAGDDEVLQRMRRGYTAAEYRGLVRKIRERIPGVAIHTDIIVGFPGETEAQFQRTYDLLAELRLDKVHLARYSPRPGTVAARRMPDDIPDEEKRRRHQLLEALQERILTEINWELLGQTVEILVEGKHKGKWQGRTRTDKIVFFEHPDDWHGKLAQVRITWAGPWSLQGRVTGSCDPRFTPLSLRIST